MSFATEPAAPPPAYTAPAEEAALVRGPIYAESRLARLKGDRFRDAGVLFNPR